MNKITARQLCGALFGSRPISQFRRDMMMDACAPPRCRRLMLAGATVAMLMVSARSFAADTDIPHAIPEQIAQAWGQARQQWTPEASFARMQLERDAAGQPFNVDITFFAASRAKLFHIKMSPKASSAGEGVYHYMGSLTGRVIDLPQAVTIARKLGMKGNLVTADLSLWLPHNRTFAVEVWRLVPDDDPNSADPNDPNMKNYFVDAITGAPYAAENPDDAALEQGRDALGQAVTKDMMDFVQSLQRH